MQGIITFKGKEKGLEIYLDERSTYPVLREELMEKLKKNQAEINKDFERINPQLDAIMAKIEAFYKENYPDYLW